MKAFAKIESFGPFLEVKPFDEFDDGIIHDVCEGPILAKPVQALLITLSQMKKTEDSFGLNAELAMKQLYPLLVDLRKACKQIWEDSQ